MQKSNDAVLSKPPSEVDGQHEPTPAEMYRPTIADQARAAATLTALWVARAAEEAHMQARQAPTVRELASTGTAPQLPTPDVPNGLLPRTACDDAGPSSSGTSSDRGQPPLVPSWSSGLPTCDAAASAAEGRGASAGARAQEGTQDAVGAEPGKGDSGGLAGGGCRTR
eukprot:670199-Prymnesium_polylepis.1